MAHAGSDARAKKTTATNLCSWLEHLWVILHQQAVAFNPSLKHMEHMKHVEHMEHVQ